MSKDYLNIVFVINNNKEQHKLFEMCVRSLLKYNKVDNIIVVYFNISENEITNVCSFIKGVNLSLIYFDINKVDDFFPNLPNTCNSRLRYPSLLRWWLPKIVNVDYFWYVDTDIIFTDSIKEKFLLIQNEDLYFFAFNRKIYYTYKEYYKDRKYYKHTNKLNGGILFINAKAFNEMNMFDDIVSFYINNSKNIYYMNQDGYQYLFEKYYEHSRIEISDIYNINIQYIFNLKHHETPIKIFHFNGVNKTLMYSIFEYLIANKINEFYMRTNIGELK